MVGQGSFANLPIYVKMLDCWKDLLRIGAFPYQTMTFQPVV